MQLWTTFAPSKVTWEITTVRSKGKNSSSDWMLHKDIINDSLALLKQSGIDGIRLVIFPSEITADGKNFNWIPVDTMLAMCKKHKLLVDLCIGPYQYPHYPGIYLPKSITGTTSTTGFLDEIKELRVYGFNFLKKQLDRYSSDDRIRGFHFANEWPDMQRVSGREELRVGISKEFMLEATRMIKKATKKPVSLNTNIDASSRGKLFETFKEIFAILDKQGKLGFDIYPSQETWKKTPWQKLKRFVEAYTTSFTKICRTFAPCEMYFAEVEAQPWGDGRSWYRIIKAEENPKEEILGYTKQSLQQTCQTHIANTPCQTTSLWGSDFWLSAHEMGVNWPLKAVSNNPITQSLK